MSFTTWPTFFLWAALSALVLTMPPSAKAECVPADVVVALDIGHSVAQPGATSARGLPEYIFNFNLASLMLSQLHEAGFTSSFIIDTKGNITSLSARAAEAAHRGAHVLISIHHDSVQPQYLSQWTFEGRSLAYSDRFRGYSLFVSERNRWPEHSLRLAFLIGEELRARNLTPSLHHAEPIAGENRPLLDRDRGVYRYDGLAILSMAPMPAVLLEAGVIVHRDEEILLQQEQHQKAIASAISATAYRYCTEQIQPPTEESTKPARK